MIEIILLVICYLLMGALQAMAFSYVDGATNERHDDFKYVLLTVLWPVFTPLFAVIKVSEHLHKLGKKHRIKRVSQ